MKHARRSSDRRPGAARGGLQLLIAALIPASALAQQTMPEVSVTGTREQEKISETPASVGVIQGETVRLDRPSHPSQVMSQVPGVAVAVTNGEGHTTSIRQPFTTSPVYLFLEDGVPIRSTGFFNHNALYEVNLPQSGGVEVVRGPGTALYGSDAIGGIINTLSRTPPREGEFSAFGEVGSFGWWRTLIGGGGGFGDNAMRGDLNLTHTDGWREQTAYDRQAGSVRWDRALGADGTLKTLMSFSHVDQQTGANSPLVMNDYLNNPQVNYFPIAFRKVTALRLSSAYEQEFGSSLLSLTPYFRDDSMELLASFNLNNDPTVYTTANRSFGLQGKWRTDFQPMRTRVIGGVDLDVSPGGREEDSIRTVTVGTGASRQHLSYSTAARVYDYDVTYRAVSPYLHGEISPIEPLRLMAGVRYDYSSYDFNNNIGASSVTVAPVAGTFPTGTRIYGQATDTTISFSHTSPKFGATYALNADTNVFVSRNHGFRAPSEGDLFRPSFGTSAAAAQAQVDSALGLKPIKADQLEGGLRGKAFGASYELIAYELKKRDDIVTQRDTATNFTQRVNAGQTRHRGIEVGLGVPFGQHYRLDAAYTYRKQTYDNWVTSNGDFSGKEIESAPRALANARVTWLPAVNTRVQLEWIEVGSYWLDAANTAKYGGYSLLNLRTNWEFYRGYSLFASIYNIGDKRYADSASISSSTQVLSPGLPRAYYVGLEGRW
jgi:outer membrane receptor protein involved in Fe transport